MFDKEWYEALEALQNTQSYVVLPHRRAASQVQCQPDSPSQSVKSIKGLPKLPWASADRDVQTKFLGQARRRSIDSLRAEQQWSVPQVALAKPKPNTP